MGIGNIQQTGLSGLMAAKAAISTAGHNIANANTEGYSRQRVVTEAAEPQAAQGVQDTIGTGTRIGRIERINDEYVEKQIQNAQRDLSNLQEKDVSLKQLEDIFNEMNGDGLNRIVTRFFNEFRKLSNEPENDAIRQAVREASRSVINELHRLRREVQEVQTHIDSRIEGCCGEVNATAAQLRDLNIKIHNLSIAGGSPNDLLDTRDRLLKKLASYVDIGTHYDQQGLLTVDVKGMGALISGPQAETFSVTRTPADDQGKPENSVDIHCSASASSNVTHLIHGGKLGALVEVRDRTLSGVLKKLDSLAFALSTSVNEIHRQGFTREGRQGIDFFKPLDSEDRASEFIDLSDAVRADAGNIVTAAAPAAPGDNRIALAISGLQNQGLLADGHATLDEWFNSIVSDVGVVAAKNRMELHQQQDIMNQLGKIREQVSGVSMDEETANLMQFQHAYDASAKVIQIADEMLKTVLDLKR